MAREQQQGPGQPDFEGWTGLNEVQSSWIERGVQSLRQIEGQNLALVGLTWLGHQTVTDSGMDGHHKLIAVSVVAVAATGITITGILARRSAHGTAKNTADSAQP
jgi:hypothetical protein